VQTTPDIDKLTTERTGPMNCRCEFYEPWENQDGECSCGHALAEHLGHGQCIAVVEVKDTGNEAEPRYRWYGNGS